MILSEIEFYMFSILNIAVTAEMMFYAVLLTHS